MAGKLKIREIAALTGLSTGTVSRVLAGKANTSAQARQAVLACAEARGVLAGLGSGRLLLNNLTVFAPPRAFDVRTDVFYYKVVQGLRSAVADKDVRVGYCALDENDSDIPLFLRRIGDPSCEAALILGIDDHRVHDIAADLGKPCVLINCRDRGMRLDAVMPDHQRIGECAARHLLELGHREILALLCLRRRTMESRLDGIREAFAEQHIEFDESRHLVTTNGFGAQESRQAIAAHFSRLAPAALPTAILAGGDFMAVGAGDALEAIGLTVPRDVSLLSMDGINLAEIHDVPLSAVQVPRDDLAPEALRLLQQRRLRPDAPPALVLLGGRLAARSSVRRLAGRKAKAAPGPASQGVYGD